MGKVPHSNNIIEWGVGQGLVVDRKYTKSKRGRELTAMCQALSGALLILAHFLLTHTYKKRCGIYLLLRVKELGNLPNITQLASSVD